MGHSARCFAARCRAACCYARWDVAPFRSFCLSPSIPLCTQPVYSYSHTQPVYSTPQFKELLVKYLRVYWRMPSYNFARVAMTFLVSWIYASTYWMVRRPSQTPTNPADYVSAAAVLVQIST